MMRSILYTVDDMRAFTAKARDDGRTIGFVPTMGALHEGHFSLIRRSAEENDVTVVSIFVNPIQFEDPDDFSAYPQTLKTDALSAFAEGADAVFAPSAAEMYPDGFSTYIDMTGVSEKLCGASRTSHFKGVLTVVGKLFGILGPDRAYFGEKDAQQLAVVKKMTAELCMKPEIIGCPTVREKDGLAMSSRNARLSAIEREAALSLYQALNKAKNIFEEGETDPQKLATAMEEVIKQEPLARIDYAALVDPVTFETPDQARSGDLLTAAVFIGEIRLIDNLGL